MHRDHSGRLETASWEAGAVAAVFVVCLVGALAYVARFASWVPWWDYWELSEVIAREQPLDRAWLLAPHQ